MISWLHDKLNEVQTLVLAATVLLAIITMVGTWWRSKSLVPTLTSALLAGFVLWGVNNVTWFQTKVGEETAFEVHFDVAAHPAPPSTTNGFRARA